MWIADSYAKINLGLNVLSDSSAMGSDHETGLCFIDWRDRFEVKHAAAMEVEAEDQSTNDAVTQAIETLSRYVGLENNYHIKAGKRIPINAGLSDRSSNIALTLRMLNKIENLGLSNNDLIDLGTGLARNIHFFITGETGIYSGAAEFEPFAIQPHFWIVTCFPAVENQANTSIPNTFQPEPDYSLKDELTKQPPEEWRYTLFNDFERTVFQETPVAGNLKDQFYEFGAIYASMTGRGTSVYGLFDQNFVAVDAYTTLIDLGYSANLTPPLFKPDYGIYQKE